MIDFLLVSARNTKNGTVEVYPKFIIRNPSADLMIRGGDFYAVWIERENRWSTNEQDVIDMVDTELDAYAKEYRKNIQKHLSEYYICGTRNPAVLIHGTDIA